MAGDKLQNLYNFVSSSKAIENLPDYNTFKSGLQDPAKAKNFFSFLKTNNVVSNLPEDYNFFAIPLGLPTSMPKGPAQDFSQGLMDKTNTFTPDPVSKRPPLTVEPKP